MLNQLSSLRAIESDSKMVNSLESLVSQNQFAAASQLIGSLVSGITLGNQRLADMVISVSQTAQGPVLNLFGGERMFFDQVDEIAGPIDDFVIPDEDDDNDDDDTTPPDPNTGPGFNPPTPVIGDIDQVDLDVDQRDTPIGDPIGQIFSPAL